MVDKTNTETPNRIRYVLDTNVLLHDPNALLNFDEHLVSLPMTVLEELDNLKTAKQTVAAEARQAIRLIDKLLGTAAPALVEKGVPIQRGKNEPNGFLSIMTNREMSLDGTLPNTINDNRIINQVIDIKRLNHDEQVILVTKDINMRLKARAIGIEAEDYSSDQLVDDVDLLSKGFHSVPGSFWDLANKVESRKSHDGHVWQTVEFKEKIPGLSVNEYILDENKFVGWVKEINGDKFLIQELNYSSLMNREAWGLKPRDIYQALALDALLDPDIHLVNLSGAAGSGKTILALAAAIEMTVASKEYYRIIATRSVQGLDEDIGFLPGTEAEKMEPWLGAITDNLEALHMEDESTQGSVDYILDKVPLQFKSLNFIRGRSFQRSLILIDECQNLTPHQMKTIITRAGKGSKVICLGNLAQIDTPYLSATSSGLTYLSERFKGFAHGTQLTLQGVPRSILAEYAETHM